MGGAARRTVIWVEVRDSRTMERENPPSPCPGPFMVENALGAPRPAHNRDGTAFVALSRKKRGEVQ